MLIGSAGDVDFSDYMVFAFGELFFIVVMLNIYSLIFRKD